MVGEDVSSLSSDTVIASNQRASVMSDDEPISQQNYNDDVWENDPFLTMTPERTASAKIPFHGNAPTVLNAGFHARAIAHLFLQFLEVPISVLSR